jgi:hypothetical protein
VCQAIIDGVNEEARGRGIDALARERDTLLVKVLETVNLARAAGESLPPGA